MDRHLRALDELLDEGGAAARGRDRSTEGGRELTAVPHDRNRVAAAVRRLDHARHADVEMRVCRQPPGDVRDAGLGEALALPDPRGRDRRGRRRERMREAEPLRHARGDPDRRVRSGRRDAVDRLRLGQPVDRRLVVGWNQRPAVDEREAGGRA